VPHSSPGKKFVETDVRLANDARLMARSVVLHAQRDEVTGSRHRFARGATAAARHVLPEPEVNWALRAHRLVYSAKLGVRLPPGAEPRALAAPSGAAKRPRSQWADLAVDADPWAGIGGPWQAIWCTHTVTKGTFGEDVLAATVRGFLGTARHRSRGEYDFGVSTPWALRVTWRAIWR